VAPAISCEDRRARQRGRVQAQNLPAGNDLRANLIWLGRDNTGLQSLRFRGRVTDHGVFVLHHAAGKLQRFRQLITFRRHQRSRQKLTRYLGRGRPLKLLYEMTRGLKTGLPFNFLSDVCRLKGKIDASGGAVGLIRGDMTCLPNIKRA
jgi:hypothetical protein